ncbi:MAG: glutathionylspermidine synthase family protein [Phycisphaerales bacterium]|nr:glutathionylspermidine synthase family protein [Phycisphaerales bacterium]
MNAPLRCPPPLGDEAYLALRRRVIFECGKWDPQCEDVQVLARFPIVITQQTWHDLAHAAEALDSEALDAEREILARPDLHAHLGLPRAIRRALSDARIADSPRCTRFDFHLTTDGWRISEANSDVPGGFIEGGAFPRLFSQIGKFGPPVADPAQALADAVLRRAGPRIALVHATAYTDDRQVMLHLARLFEQRGAEPVPLAPDRIRWNTNQPADALPFDSIVRFFPAEWLPNLPRRAQWQHFFDAGVPQTNPPTALLTQSKRFPLVWDRLATPMRRWRELLPETRDPRAINPKHEDWILKPALGRVGDGIGMRGVNTPREWRDIARAARRFPRWWAAQRRFQALAIETPDGPRFPCLGVFVIDGLAAGIYARMATRPLIDARAQDVPVLLNQPAHAHCTCGESHGRPAIAV